MKSGPKISFGIIVLNGEPFTRYNLKSIYQYAFEIVIVEGASQKAAKIATPDGHSADKTLDILYKLKREIDHENKITIVTAEDHGYPNGFWPGGKDEQSHAYAVRASGDYLWQIDIDEFYHPDALKKIIEMLNNDREISQINFRWLNFWGDFKYLIEGIFIEKHYASLNRGVPRIFKWGKGYHYITHRPPTVTDQSGKNVRTGKALNGNILSRKGIFCFHYSAVFPRAVENRMKYYSTLGWNYLGNFNRWYAETYKKIKKPFRVHHVTEEVSWLKKYHGSHPPQIEKLQEDIQSRRLNVELRKNDDIKKLLENKRYKIGVKIFTCVTPFLLIVGSRAPIVEKYIQKMVECIFSPKLN